jgi:hypothetical protein
VDRPTAARRRLPRIAEALTSSKTKPRVDPKKTGKGQPSRSFSARLNEGNVRLLPRILLSFLAKFRWGFRIVFWSGLVPQIALSCANRNG